MHHLSDFHSISYKILLGVKYHMFYYGDLYVFFSKAFSLTSYCNLRYQSRRGKKQGNIHKKCFINVHRRFNDDNPFGQSTIDK